MNNVAFGLKRAGRTGLMASLIAASAAGDLAHAVSVTNVSSGAVVFETDFESGLSTLTPSVGVWSRIGPSVNATDSTTPPAPGAIEGSFYGSVFRNSNTNGQGDLMGTLGAVQSVAGDVVQLSFMLYVPSDSEGVLYRANMFLSDGDFTDFRARALTDGAGNVLADGPGFVRTDTGIDYLPDTWQRWELTYEIGSTTFSVRVGDSLATGLAAPSVGQVSRVGFGNGSMAPGVFYLDAVPIPEPATGALLLAGLGLVGSAAARRRCLTPASPSATPAPRASAHSAPAARSTAGPAST